MINKKLSIIAALSLFSITIVATDTTSIEKELKKVRQQKQEAFAHLESWLNGYAAYSALCLTLGCEKQAEIIALLRQCQKESPCMPCVEKALGQLKLNEAYRKEAVKYIGAIPALDKTEQYLLAQKAKSEEELKNK